MPIGLPLRALGCPQECSADPLPLIPTPAYVGLHRGQRHLVLQGRTAGSIGPHLDPEPDLLPTVARDNEGEGWVWCVTVARTSPLRPKPGLGVSMGMQACMAKSWLMKLSSRKSPPRMVQRQILGPRGRCTAESSGAARNRKCSPASPEDCSGIGTWGSRGTATAGCGTTLSASEAGGDGTSARPSRCLRWSTDQIKSNQSLSV